MQIIIEDKMLEEVPVLNVYNVNQTGRLPVVIVLHGLDSHKENNLKPAYKLARAGFFVVLFDALYHGERKNFSFDNLSYWEKIRGVIQIQLDNVETIDPLIANCRNNPRANPNRVGLMGFSIGGNSVYKYISGVMPEYIKAAVAFSATPRWSSPIRKMATAPEAVEVITPDLINHVESIEPYHTMGRLRDFPLLMVNGSLDEVFSVQDVRDCYQELLPNYNDKERLVQMEYADAGHTVTDEMLSQATGWFQKFLK